jgi:hypothetical protein
MSNTVDIHLLLGSFTSDDGKYPGKMLGCGAGGVGA